MNEIILNTKDYFLNDIFSLIVILFLIFLPIGVILRSYGISREKFSISSIIILFLSLPIIIISIDYFI